MRPIILIVSSLILISSFGQEWIIPGQSVEIVYRGSDSSQNFYLALSPKTQPKGLLVILPGFGTSSPRAVLRETDLPLKAQNDGYFVLIPQLGVDTDYTDGVSQGRLNTLIPEVIKKYKIPENHFIIGGHSIGGNGALLYSENAYKSAVKK